MKYLQLYIKQTKIIQTLFLYRRLKYLFTLELIFNSPSQIKLLDSDRVNFPSHFLYLGSYSTKEINEIASCDIELLILILICTLQSIDLVIMNFDKIVKIL